ncbi:MAG: hypothetical protein HQK52_23700 [Oligoflexia bacterium]|nr:hypothetical protein [Oligoflexia bacterium]
MKKIFFGLLLMSLSQSSLCSYDKNLTLNFLDKLHDTVNRHPKDMATFERFVDELRRYKIVFVPGWFGGLGKLVFERNFREQTHWLKSKLHFIPGEDYAIAPINTFSSTKKNALTLKKFIEASNRQVIIITHSKGGIDTIEALVAYPELQKKVRGIITFQTPFKGTPIADRFNARLFTKIIAGSSLPIINVSPEERTEFIDNNKEALRALLEKIPMINLVGWLEDTPLANQIAEYTFCGNDKDKIDDGLSAIFPPQSIARRQLNGRFFSGIIKTIALMLASHGYALNDFIIPKESQRLLNAHYVELPGIDHFSLIMTSYHNHVDKIRTTIYLLQILLEIRDQSNENQWK